MELKLLQNILLTGLIFQLLIVPYGIETPSEYPADRTYIPTFNRTLWN